MISGSEELEQLTVYRTVVSLSKSVTANLKTDMASEQAPLGHTTVDSSEPGAATTIPEASGGKPSRHFIPYDDEEFNRKVKETETQVLGCFRNAFSHFERSTHGTGGRGFKERWNDDHDTIESQMRNTTAQVVGTFRGLSFAFHEAEQKRRGLANKSDSSEAEVAKVETKF